MPRRSYRLILALLAVLGAAPILAQTPVFSPTNRQRAVAAREPDYFPDRFDWQHKKPEDVGMNSALVN